MKQEQVWFRITFEVSKGKLGNVMAALPTKGLRDFQLDKARKKPSTEAALRKALKAKPK